MTYAIYIEQLREIDKALGGGGKLDGNIVERVERLTAENAELRYSNDCSNEELGLRLAKIQELETARDEFLVICEMAGQRR